MHSHTGSRTKTEEANEKSVEAIFVLPEANVAADIFAQLEERQFYALAIATMEGEGGLILPEYQA